MRYRLITFLVFGSAVTAIGEWNLKNQRLEPLKKLNALWLDFCVGNSGGKIGNPSVTFVRIDDEYEPLNIGGNSTPKSDDATPPKLSRLDFATILGFVGKQKPKTVAFIPTPTFDNKNLLNQTDIVPLKDAALQLPRMTIGAVVSGDGKPSSESENVQYPSIKALGDTELLPALTRTVKAPDPQLLANGDPAFTIIETFPKPMGNGDANQKVPLVAKQGAKVVPSFVLCSLANQAGIGLDQITLHLEKPKPFIQIGDLYTVPVSEDGAMEVPVHGGLKDSMISEVSGDDGKRKKAYHFTRLTVNELAYTGKEEDAIAKRILAKFQGKFQSVAENLVLIGFDRNLDRRIPAAGDEFLSESSLLARAIATIQSGRFINWWPQWGRWIAALAILGIAVFLFRLSRRKVAVFGGLAVLIFFTACVFVFRATLTWTPPFVMFSLFGLALAIGLILPRNHSQPVDPSEDPDPEG